MCLYYICLCIHTDIYGILGETGYSGPKMKFGVRSEFKFIFKLLIVVWLLASYLTTLRCFFICIRKSEYLPIEPLQACDTVGYKNRFIKFWHIKGYSINYGISNKIIDDNSNSVWYTITRKLKCCKYCYSNCTNEGTQNQRS